MTPGRVLALVLGCLLLLPGGAMLLGGAGLSATVLLGRDDTGHLSGPVRGLETTTVAVVAEEPAFAGGTGSTRWLADVFATDIRLVVRPTTLDGPVFVGIGPAADVASYLAGAARADVVGLVDGDTALLRTRSGVDAVAPPGEQPFWVAESSGSGARVLDWDLADGRWALVVMNADGTSGVATTATVGVGGDFLLRVALALVLIGALLTVGALGLIVLGVSGRGPETAAVPAPLAVPAGRPVVLSARLDPDVSRWRWLLKWFLAIPHWIALAFLWPAFLVVTVVAGLCILVTGVYPRVLFEFNLGVLRWSWRVGFYAASGGIGTDRYPPFSLGADRDYPATLDIVYPARLSRGMVLVKWWLLAIPQYLVVWLLIGGWSGWTALDGQGRGSLDGGLLGGGVLGLLTLVAGIVLLVTGRYPVVLFDLIVGFNRWLYRVVAYAALMTDTYPPFRLDQGGAEPPDATPPLPTTDPTDHRAPEPVGSLR